VGSIDGPVVLAGLGPEAAAAEETDDVLVRGAGPGGPRWAGSASRRYGPGTSVADVTGHMVTAGRTTGGAVHAVEGGSCAGATGVQVDTHVVLEAEDPTGVTFVAP